MRLRLALFAAAFAASCAVLAPAAARADDSVAASAVPRTVPYPSIFSLELGPEASYLAGWNTPVGGVAASLLVGIDRRWSAGIGASGLMAPLAVGLGRLDAEARYMPLLGRWGDLWLGGGAGVGVVAGGEGSTGQPSAGPHLGFTTGADVRPLSFLSLGIHARLGGYYFAPENVSARVWPEATLGIVLSLGLPKEGP